ncbi:MAG: ABC transporter ATP-binding protein [Proteocatella sp.]
MDRTREILLQTKGITKVYGEKIKTKVLRGISLSMDRQEFASIIGPSGCGKTTLLNILGTLDNPTAGDIMFRGRDIASMGDVELAEFRNQNLGFIFQFHHLLPEFTALENVLIPTWIKYKKANRKDLAKAAEILEMVGLQDIINSKSTEISGGQQQRVAIARALINSPQLILADEPTGNLDSENTQQVYDLFRKINKELKTTLLIITHDRDLAAKSDRIIEMKDGIIERDYKNEATT